MSKDLQRALLRAKPQPFQNVNDAKAAWNVFRLSHGLKGTPKLLTPPEANTKFAKTPVPVYGLSLAPNDVSGINVCRYSTPECRRGCVAFAGHGEMPYVLKVRTVKTLFLAEQPHAFVTLLADEISALARKHYVRGGKEQIGIRLNAFSDLLWEEIAPWLFKRVIPEAVQFYDYTKWPFGTRDVPANYHLTYSVSERTSPEEMAHTLVNGGNLAMVLNVRKGVDMPPKWRGFDVIDGDASDARYVNASMGAEHGKIIGLRPKGRMRTGKWNMIYRADGELSGIVV